MNTVEYVKSVCKERKIPISRLERECGFSNGYIASLKKGKFPSNRLQVISDYLDVPLSQLLQAEDVPTSGQQEGYYLDAETIRIAQAIHDNKELQLLFNEAKDADPSDLQAAHGILLALKRKERGNID